MSEQGRGDGANHLRGIGGRGAEDTGQEQPRPDEAATEPPPAIQATHAGLPVDDPPAERREESGVGRDSIPTRDRDGGDRGRYQGHGGNAEGAFGEEEPE